MLIGRFLFIIPLLAAAGSLAAKKRIPATAGRSRRMAAVCGLLVGTVIIVGALTFFPALSLGPIVEHFLMLKGGRSEDDGFDETACRVTPEQHRR